MSYIKKGLIVLLAFVVLLTSIVGCSDKSDALSNAQNPSVSVSDDYWETVDTLVTLENDNIVFELDAETTHFKVTNKKTGDIYYSVPEQQSNYIADDVSLRTASEITVMYCGEQTDKLYMYSSESVEDQLFSVKTDGNRVRVYYTLGEVGSFVPLVFDEKTFETLLESIENSGIRRRIERYYIFTSVSEESGEYQENLKQYPILGKENLYIIDDSLSDIEKDDIATYIEEIGFEKEQYINMLKRLEISDESSEEENPAFSVPVEYTLTSDGFQAEILADKVSEKSAAYKIQTIEFLEYFAAYQSEQGDFFLPDGCGALIPFNSMSNISIPYYGWDYSTSDIGAEEFSDNMPLPVFGINGNKNGIFAVIEQGAEVAQLNIKPLNESNSLNHAYASFDFRKVDVTDIGADSQIPIYNLFSSTILSVSPRVRYILLADSVNNYASMADLYRKYLGEKGVIGNTDSVVAPVYMDFICMITEKSSMMGVPYRKKTVLSTIEEITEQVKKAQNAGLKNIVIRLFGYTSYGYEHSAYNEFSIDKDVGTVNELAQLSSLLEENGGKLYLDADMIFAYSDGAGFSLEDDTARYLNKLVVCNGSYDIVNRNNSNTLKKYMISPVNYRSYTSDYLDSLIKKWPKGCKLPGLSYGTAGLYLGGDYNKKYDFDRSETAAFISKALSDIAKHDTVMAFDNGNSYILNFAASLFNAPATASFAESESGEIPFLQMVLHGSVPYALTPENVSVNSRKVRLMSLAFGASPYATFITRNDSLLYNTDYESEWYSLSVQNRLNDFVEFACKTQTFRTNVFDAYLTDFTESEGVLRADYSNGSYIYVNLNETSVTVFGEKISAGGYLIGE